MVTESHFANLLKKVRDDLLLVNVELKKYVKGFPLIPTLEAVPYFNARPGYYFAALVPDGSERSHAGLGAQHRNVFFSFFMVGFVFLLQKEIGLIGSKKKDVRGLMQLEQDLIDAVEMQKLSGFITGPLTVNTTEYQGLDFGDGNLFQGVIIGCAAMKEVPT